MRLTSSRIIRGGIAGAIAWAAMDHTLRTIYNRHPADVRRRERDARDGVPALEVLAHRLGETVGRTLTTDERQTAGTMLQWSMGVGAGVLYSCVRERIPGPGIRRGLLFGAAFSLIVDEGLTPLFGLAPGPAKFPWQTHARGFAGHLIFGAVAEGVLAVTARSPASRTPSF